MVGRLEGYLYAVENVMILCGGVSVFSLMCLAVVSVLGRNFFGQPLLGYIDWIEQAMVPIAFLGISYVHRIGEHIRMDIFIGKLRGRSLFLVEMITTVFIFLLLILLVWGSWSHFERSFDFSSPLWSRDSTMDISIPIWPAKLLVPFSFSLLCLRLCFQIYGYVICFYKGFVPREISFLPESEIRFLGSLEEDLVDDGGVNSSDRI